MGTPFYIQQYCDDNEIGMSRDSTNSYLYEYMVKDLSVGLHSLKSCAKYENGDAQFSTSATTNFNVIE